MEKVKQVGNTVKSTWQNFHAEYNAFAFYLQEYNRIINNLRIKCILRLIAAITDKLKTHTNSNTTLKIYCLNSTF
jgi:hypothetical protein